MARLPTIPVQRRRVVINDVPITFQVLGSGPPLVLVHGLSGSTRWWAHNVQALAQRFRVYVVDLIGFGANRGHPFVLREASTYLRDWMDQLDIPTAHLVGHSMGGYVAAEFAADFPEHVDRMVLVDAAVLPFEHSQVRYLFRLGQEVRNLDPRFLPVLATDTLRAGVGTVWWAARQLFTSDLRDKVAAITTPTLIVWGERDRLVPLTLGRDLHRVAPHWDFVILAGAGHNSMWDCPQAFNREVTAFLCGGTPHGDVRTIACER